MLFKSGRLDEAKFATAKALKLDTPEPRFYYHPGKIALTSGDTKAAREYADRLLSLNPRFDIGKTGVSPLHE